MKDYETTEDFKERLRQMIGPAPVVDKPCVRSEDDEGFYPPPRKINKPKRHEK
jgi:hypothetical protein